MGASTRVRAHIFLTMLAYYVEWHIKHPWRELLFTDESPDPNRDPVAPARRSEPALENSRRPAPSGPKTAAPSTVSRPCWPTSRPLPRAPVVATAPWPKRPPSPCSPNHRPSSSAHSIWSAPSRCRQSALPFRFGNRRKSPTISRFRRGNFSLAASPPPPRGSPRAVRRPPPARSQCRTFRGAIGPTRFHTTHLARIIHETFKQTWASGDDFP